MNANYERLNKEDCNNRGIRKKEMNKYNQILRYYLEIISVSMMDLFIIWLEIVFAFYFNYYIYILVDSKLILI